MNYKKVQIMKQLFLSSAIIACMSSSVVAGEVQSKKQRGNRNPIKELNLSEDQKKQMDGLQQNYKNQLKDLNADATLNQSDKKAKQQEISQNHRAEVKKILTPEQQTKMEALKKDRPKRQVANNEPMRKHKGEMKNQRQNRMKDLNLTDEQVSKIKELNKQFAANTKEMAQERRNKMNEILTPEQQAKMKEANKDSHKDLKNGHRRFSDKNKQGKRGKLDSESVEKMKTLKEEYKKELSAIEKSRIAPEQQEKQKTELKAKFREEIRQLHKESRNKKKAENNKPA